MRVEILVDDMKQFADAEMYLFGLEFDRHISFEIFVYSTGETWFYSTEYHPEIDKWLVETI